MLFRSIDTVIFDKTGTLTLGRPRLTNSALLSSMDLALAAGLARSSRHPLSRAVCEAAKSRGITPAIMEYVQELPGRGLSASFQGEPLRLGSRQWCGIEENDGQRLPEFVLMRDSKASSIFTFEDELRGDAAAVIAKLKSDGLRVEILSGDREVAVRRAASALGIEQWKAGVTPQQKLAYIEQHKAAGRKVLMVGDGLNDAPALAAGLTSMAPASATDIGRTAADTIFMGESLRPVLVARDVAIATQRLSIQNFVLAVGYNFLAVPIAMLGFASPLIAAVAMSTSSIIVIGNSLRLGFFFRTQIAVPAVKPQQAQDLPYLERRAA